MFKTKKTFVGCLVVLILVGLVTSCTPKESPKKVSSGENEIVSRSSKLTTTSTTTVSTVDSSKSFQAQVQDVCNSVDPQVFNDIIHVDISKDKGFTQKFKIAVDALDKLEKDFGAITPPKTNANDWALGLDNIAELKVLVARVSDQYSEYLALTKESQNVKDLTRLSEIINRLAQLVTEYISTLQSIQTRFTEVLRIGVVAGTYECKAFQIS